MKKQLFRVLTCTSISAISAMALSSPALAQVAPPQPADADAAAAAEQSKDIVVTGTQIRGIKPVGSNVITQDRDAIQATGVNDSNQLLGELPQSSFFLSLPQPGGGVIQAGTARVPIQKPNLRDIPGGTTSTGAQTLVLIDGHRVVPSGIQQSAVDAGVVPLGILQRTEVILDGTSAVYGSDAVGGVINYITRRHFNGLELNANYGIAPGDAGTDYWQASASVTIGKDWGSGSIALNYDFSKNSMILNRDRSYTAPINWFNPLSPVTGLAVLATAGGTPALNGVTCDVPNVKGPAPAALPFHVDGANVPAGAAFCNASAYSTFNPAQTRHSAFLTFQQDITDAVKFDVTALYSHRFQETTAGPFTATVNIRGTNPFYRCIPALGACPNNTATAPIQAVSLSFGPLLGNSGRLSQFSNTKTQIWQVSPSLSVDVGHDWLARAYYSYGQSVVAVHQNRMDATKLASYFLAPAAPATSLTAGQTFDPYNLLNPLSAGSNSLITGTLWDNYTDGRHTYQQARISADGPLFTLPGGDVKLAVGAEWSDTKFKTRITDATTFILQPYSSSEQIVKSAFGELDVPIIGEGNRGMFHSLTFSASARYDDYGQFGDTFNPKFGLTFEPVDWIALRGSWGKSFRAPNVVDKLGAGPGALLRCIGQTGCAAGGQSTLAIVQPSDAVAVAKTFDPNITTLAQIYDATAVALVLTGDHPDLKPESSTGWSLGLDVKPPIIPGLTLSGTYWHIDFRNFISTPNTGLAQTPIRDNFGDLYWKYIQPSGAVPITAAAQAILNSYYAQANSGPSVQQYIATVPGAHVVEIIDSRTTNLGGDKISGIDFSARYRMDTGFGSVDASVGGTRRLTNKARFIPTGPVTDQLAFDTPKFRMSSTLGVNVGDFRAQVTERHEAGYVPSFNATRVATQTRIPGFDVVDLSFNWNVNGTGPLTKDLRVSFIVNNVADAHPPLSLTANGGTANGQTLGRLFQLGISKSFK